ncbi:MAG: ComEC/Rec2 family competence protein [Spirochaetales bacterium]|nr:ComEC/Rec2 family competence protein [Spirochaetales bacterium]
MFCLFITNTQIPEDISPGQDKKVVTGITARVLEDSREIGGGKFIFSIKLLSAEDINSTITSASGQMTVASNINLYKGQIIRIDKRNIFRKYSSIIFIDRKNIELLKWDNTYTSEILRLRVKILDSLKLRIGRMHPDSSLLFSALFTGIKENPKGKLFTSLRKAGASHILALSGMHLGIISFGVMFLVTILIGRKLSFIFTLFIVFLYVFLVSSGPSLTRALILFTLLGLFALYGVKVDIFHILIICFLIQVVIDPGSAYELSFQLSYLALGGIILGSDYVSRILPGFIPPGVRGILAASFSAQIFTAPLVLYSFGVIYPVGIVSGLILVPIITLFIWIGILTLLPMPWLVQRILFWIMEELYVAVEISADFFSKFPFFP